MRATHTAGLWLSEWVLWGGIPHRRFEVYRWMQKAGVSYCATADAPAMDEDEAVALRARFEEEGCV